MAELSDDNWYEICKHCKSEHHILYQVSRNLQKIVMRFVEPINNDNQLDIACRNSYMLDIIKCNKKLNWNWGLYGACLGGHMQIVDKMINLGANECNCGKSIQAHYQN